MMPRVIRLVHLFGVLGFLCLRQRGLAPHRESSGFQDPSRQLSFYASCLDTVGIAALGIEPLRPTLELIGGIRSVSELPHALSILERRAATAPFVIGRAADFRNSKETIVSASQGGLGLPDREYYLKTDGGRPTTRRSTRRCSEDRRPVRCHIVIDASTHVNGRLTLGEKIASIDGFTPEQRFFLSWAQMKEKTVIAFALPAAAR